MFNNPKQRIAAILSERKKSLGPVPKSPMAPINSIRQMPGMSPPSPIAPQSNPMAPAVTSLVKPNIPGMGKFGRIKKMF